MISYELTTSNGQKILVSLEATDPHERSPLTCQGEPEIAQVVRNWIKSESGAFGHLIGEITTPVDLHFLMNSPAARFLHPILVEGKELVSGYARNQTGKNEIS